MKWLFKLILLTILLLQLSCGTYQKRIAVGMFAGATVGALVGNQFVHHGENKQYETENTIITAVLFSLITGGVLAWHYREIEETKVEISGRYARYRLCDPQDMKLEMARQLEFGGQAEAKIYGLQANQIGKLAIALDDHTKWVYPSFRKRYLAPERNEEQVLSKRYIWEIVKPGSFVTRSQNPQFFYEPTGEEDETENN